MNPEAVMHHIRNKTALNELRAKFSSWCGRIEQRTAQREPLSPVDLRGLEFDAVLDLLETASRLRL